MARVLSALVLLPVVLGTIWYLPPAGTLGLAVLIGLFALHEYIGLAARLGARVPGLIAALAVAGTCTAAGLRSPDAGAVLAATVIVVGSMTVAAGRVGAEALYDVAATTFAAVYFGLPLGALVAVRAATGREALILLLGVVMVSDTAQYYGGRAFGRRLLAPSISPKKTIEGAVSGLVAGTVATAAGGLLVLPQAGPLPLGLLGATLVVLGIAGDLFESVLKRSAGVKDASGLIPGHGGMMDRIDSLLFTAPVYYGFLRIAGAV